MSTVLYYRRNEPEATFAVNAHAYLAKWQGLYVYPLKLSDRFTPTWGHGPLCGFTEVSVTEVPDDVQKATKAKIDIYRGHIEPEGT